MSYIRHLPLCFLYKYFSFHHQADKTATNMKPTLIKSSFRMPWTLRPWRYRRNSHKRPLSKTCRSIRALSFLFGWGAGAHFLTNNFIWSLRRGMCQLPSTTIHLPTTLRTTETLQNPVSHTIIPHMVSIFIVDMLTFVVHTHMYIRICCLANARVPAHLRHWPKWFTIFTFSIRKAHGTGCATA